MTSKKETSDSHELTDEQILKEALEEVFSAKYPEDFDMTDDFSFKELSKVCLRSIKKARQSERTKYEQRAKGAKSDLEFMSKTELAPIDRVNYLLDRVADERTRLEKDLKAARECIQKEAQLIYVGEEFDGRNICLGTDNCENTVCPLNEGLK